MDRYFDEELRDLREKLILMSSLVEQMIEKSISMLTERKEELAQDIGEDEIKVNMMQIEIDDFALKLIALRQPAASDLRFIISAVKINSDLERIADLAVNISQRAEDLIKEPQLKPFVDLPKMAEIAEKMVKDAIDAFINKNSALAKDVCKRDDLVDNLNYQLFRELLTYMLQDPKNINYSIELLLVARHLERIGDHATNISEDVIYIIEGRDIRHHAQDGHSDEMNIQWKP
jgi:phosphate transport system protein